MDAILGAFLILCGILYTIFIWVKIYPEEEINKKGNKLFMIILEFLGYSYGGIGILLILAGIILIMLWAGFEP